MARKNVMCLMGLIVALTSGAVVAEPEGEQATLEPDGAQVDTNVGAVDVNDDGVISGEAPAQRQRPAALGESGQGSRFGLDLAGSDSSLGFVDDATKDESGDSFGDDLSSILTGLTVVLLVVIVLGWGMRKGTFGFSGAGGLLRVKGGINLGAKEKIAVITVGGKDIVIGVTQHGISTLYVFEDGIDDSPGSVSSPTPPKSEVAQRFRELLSSDASGKNGPLG